MGASVLLEFGRSEARQEFRSFRADRNSGEFRCLKAACRSVQNQHFFELLDVGLDGATQRDLNQVPWAEGHASLTDFVRAHRYLTMLMSQRYKESDGRELRDRDVYFPDNFLHEMRRLIKTLVREDEIFISDRKIIMLYRLIRTRAWIVHGGAVEREDLLLLSYLGETVEEVDLLEEKVPKLLGVS